MKKHFLLSLGILTSLASCTSPKAELPAKNYTLIVSLDGFRHDYRDWYETPVLDSIGNEGVQATMLPSFPASTFPNHYTLATGLTPDKHGIVNNTFWDTERQVKYSLGGPLASDSTFYGGEPIWTSCVKQNVKVGTVYWVASDFHIQGIDPTYYMDYAKRPLLSFDARVDSVIAWFSKPYAERPRLIMSYFEEPDYAGHAYTPRGEETGKCVESLDSLMGVLRYRLNQLPIADSINLIITSDHGMATMDPSRVINPWDHIKPEWVEQILMGRPTSIFTKPEHREDVYQAFKKLDHLNVWKREEIPAEVNYGTYETRIGDIVIAPEVGWDVTDRKSSNPSGAHGFLPTDPQMQVMFVAQGPDFKENFKADPFVNVDIYNLLVRLLHITPAPTQGVTERIEPLLK